MHEIIKVLIAAITSFVVLFVLSTILGKKQIAQLDFVDYVVGISIGSIAAQMAIDTKTPLYYFVIAMVVFFLLDLAVSLLGRKGPFLKRIFKGKPLVLIYEGQINYKNLKKSKIDVNDLIALSRELGYFDLTKIQYALFETSGKLSVMPIASERPAVAKDLPIALTPQKLPNYLIVDGKISYSGLNEAGKNIDWLYKRLNIKNKKDLKNIILAIYDMDSDKITANYKE